MEVHDSPKWMRTNGSPTGVETSENDRARPDSSEASGFGETPIQCLCAEPVGGTDVTFMATWAGVADVCFIIDVSSRMIVGWRFASHMRTETVGTDEG